jgi:hypothetical protein
MSESYIEELRTWTRHALDEFSKRVPKLGALVRGPMVVINLPNVFGIVVETEDLKLVHARFEKEFGTRYPFLFSSGKAAFQVNGHSTVLASNRVDGTAAVHIGPSGSLLLINHWQFFAGGGAKNGYTIPIAFLVGSSSTESAQSRAERMRRLVEDGLNKLVTIS